MQSDDRLERYAVAAALSNYNLQQPDVLRLVSDEVRAGLPAGSAALNAGLSSGTLSPDDIVQVLTSDAISPSHQGWLISAICRLPSDIAFPTLAAAVRAHIAQALAADVIRAYARHCLHDVADVVALYSDAATRPIGIAVLRAIEEPATLVGVIKAVAPLHRETPEVRDAIAGMHEMLLGSLLEVVQQEWDMETLEVLFEVATLAEGQDGA
jgi:hypothetical protein